MITSLFNTFFPRVCATCDEVLLPGETVLCLPCLHQLPLINQSSYAEDLIKEHFYGRVEIAHAAALFLFHKKGISQRLLHQLKYRGREEISTFLGIWMGELLRASAWTRKVDLIIPVPLSKKRKKERGFNQVTGFGKALAMKLKAVFSEDLLFKSSGVRTQVFKNRWARSQMDKGNFTLRNPEVLRDKHILLVDDLITTGATLEACTELLNTGCPAEISLATMGITA